MTTEGTTVGIRLRGAWRLKVARAAGMLLPPGPLLEGIVWWAVERLEWSVDGGPWRPIVEDIA